MSGTLLGKIDVLGTQYVVLEQNAEQNPKLKENVGLCELYSKKIIVGEPTDDVMNYENIAAFQNRTLRHEIIHAFLGESGLRGNSPWAEDEEMVDWFAIQFEKLQTAMASIGCLSDEREIRKRTIEVKEVVDYLKDRSRVGSPGMEGTEVFVDKKMLQRAADLILSLADETKLSTPMK